MNGVNDLMRNYAFGLGVPKVDPKDTVTIPWADYEAMKRKIARLEHSAMLDSWRLNPDRMGS